MTEDTELREMLRATAQNASLPTVMPQSMRRKVTLRRARTIGVTFLMTVAIVIGGFQGMRAVSLDDAAPDTSAAACNQGDLILQTHDAPRGRLNSPCNTICSERRWSTIRRSTAASAGLRSARL